MAYATAASYYCTY